MGFISGLAIGAIVGGTFAAMIMAMLFVAKTADEQRERHE